MRSQKGLTFDSIGQTTAAGYTAGYDQTAAAAAKSATYATTYTQRPGQQSAQVAVSVRSIITKKLSSVEEILQVQRKFH